MGAKKIQTDIIPPRQTFAKYKAEHSLHQQGICVFMATGFFMDDDTYWKDQKCLLPGHEHTLDDDDFLIASVPWFKWYYSPRDISFETALENYTSLLKDITKTQIGNHKVILPLSGGLDSRSQALILKDLDNPVHSYSYSFTDGYPEHRIGQKIANLCGFEFDAFHIPRGYLWDCIYDLAEINQCYSEFTHPRQMAVLEQLKQMEGMFSLGHWGDVFFDRGAPEGTSDSDIVPLLLKKMLKPGGLYLAEQLWNGWGLEGNFKDYLISKIEVALSKLKIDNISAKVRAFKTTQWAHRWTSTNLSIFESVHPITLPFYDKRMCDFICNIPEAYLADRRLQLAHLKQDKGLSNITWQAQKPFNLNNFDYNKMPYNLPYRILDKLERSSKNLLGRPWIQRNFELQFLGRFNDQELRQWVFSKSFEELVPDYIVKDIYKKFTRENTVYYSHPMSMLLTLAVWQKNIRNVQ